jgi:hypothetical protein
MREQGRGGNHPREDAPDLSRVAGAYRLRAASQSQGFYAFERFRWDA